MIRAYTAAMRYAYFLTMALAMIASPVTLAENSPPLATLKCDVDCADGVAFGVSVDGSCADDPTTAVLATGVCASHGGLASATCSDSMGGTCQLPLLPPPPPAPHRRDRAFPLMDGFIRG